MTLNEDFIAEAKEIFTLFDLQGSGKLATAKLGDTLRALGNNPSQAQVSSLISQYDAQQQGWIDWATLLQILSTPKENYNVVASREDILRGFKAFDKEGSGNISANELKYVLTHLGEKLSEAEVQELFANVQVSKDGNIRYEGKQSGSHAGHWIIHGYHAIFLDFVNMILSI